MLYKTPNTQHCAVDAIKLYDDTLDPVELRRFLSNFRHSHLLEQPILVERADQNHVTDLCGSYTMPLDVYSTGSRLLFYFIATHYAELSADELNFDWRKGFYAEYEFLPSLTKLDFISASQSNQYVSGTECDQTIKSFGQGFGKTDARAACDRSRHRTFRLGTFQTPNWPQPYKPQTACSTYLLGLDDRFTLENVEIEFDQFDIDCQLVSLVIYNASRIYDSHMRTSTLTSDTISRRTSRSALFSSYYRQELDFKENLSFCGHFKPEGRFVSQNALLKLSFIANDRFNQHVQPSASVGGKFHAKYRFVQSYHRVSADEYDGTSPVNCNLSYYQSRTLTGEFDGGRVRCCSSCRVETSRLNDVCSSREVRAATFVRQRLLCQFELHIQFLSVERRVSSIDLVRLFQYCRRQSSSMCIGQFNVHVPRHGIVDIHVVSVRLLWLSEFSAAVLNFTFDRSISYSFSFE
jgi:hypothetical protein